MPQNHEILNDNLAYSVESIDKKKATNKYVKKAIALGLGVTITASSMFLTGCGAEKNSEGLPGPAFQTAEFQGNQNVFVSVTQLGEKSFIEKYGSEYRDPKLTYNALVAYEKENDGASAFINPKYIDYYEKTTNPGEKNGDISFLGFESKKMSLADANFDQSIDFFDNYVSVQMSLCANLLAFNPEARNTIKDQFLTYCGKVDTEYGKFTHYNQGSEALFDFIDNFVSEYPSNAYFNIQPASKDVSTIDGTYFNGGFTTGGDPINQYSDVIRPTILVSRYEDGAINSFYILPIGDKEFMNLDVYQDKTTKPDGSWEISEDISIGTTPSR